MLRAPLGISIRETSADSVPPGALSVSQQPSAQLALAIRCPSSLASACAIRASGREVTAKSVSLAIITTSAQARVCRAPSAATRAATPSSAMPAPPAGSCGRATAGATVLAEAPSRLTAPALMSSRARKANTIWAIKLVLTALAIANLVRMSQAPAMLVSAHSHFLLTISVFVPRGLTRPPMVVSHARRRSSGMDLSASSAVISVNRVLKLPVSARHAGTRSNKTRQTQPSVHARQSTI